MTHNPLDLARRLNLEVLDPLKAAFVGRDEVVDLIGVCLVASEHLFVLGPPGTAKSALIQSLARRLDTATFDYLLTRFTEPAEIFGPFDIRRLREGELAVNTEGMLPEAPIVFLDELLNANSAILNGLLGVLNDRVLRRGRETFDLPLVMAVGASNHLPEDEALGALFDRFLLRVHVDYVEEDRLEDVLRSGWALDRQSGAPIRPSFRLEHLTPLIDAIHEVELDGIRESLAALVRSVRSAGVDLSDRRAVQLQRVVAASALLAGRTRAILADLWVVRYIWSNLQEREVLGSLVGAHLAEADTDSAHPRAKADSGPDPEAIARALDALSESLSGTHSDDPTVAATRLQALRAQIEWLPEGAGRDSLCAKVDQIRAQLEGNG